MEGTRKLRERPWWQAPSWEVLEKMPRIRELMAERLSKCHVEGVVFDGHENLFWPIYEVSPDARVVMLSWRRYRDHQKSAEAFDIRLKLQREFQGLLNVGMHVLPYQALVYPALDALTGNREQRPQLVRRRGRDDHALQPWHLREESDPAPEERPFLQDPLGEGLRGLLGGGEEADPQGEAVGVQHEEEHRQGPVRLPEGRGPRVRPGAAPQREDPPDVREEPPREDTPGVTVLPPLPLDELQGGALGSAQGGRRRESNAVQASPSQGEAEAYLRWGGPRSSHGC
eukprot:CAMPEP_0113825142 /NCGR_PEP_ID=MMETSP0328-20130328/3600_1 /TAXON_ID=39455 /ORGANISM="Alexandrium minutum" /LENGTH=284 /DNA_ID=CAMNT_0000793093 /DNA_START=17 /DNA_END=868 /DNA_ORIENTATION=+ /assembly_acc=CAM_ASM_000350